MRGLDTLELPEVSLVQIERLRVSASEALRHVGIVEPLAVTKLLGAEGQTQSATEQKTACHTHVVCVKVPGGTGSLGSFKLSLKVGNGGFESLDIIATGGSSRL